MEVLIAFVLFVIGMTITLIAGGPMLVPLAIGFICFFGAALRKKYRFSQVGEMALKGAKDSLVVIYVLILIGMLTALWRSAGTIAFFVYYGIKMITPSMFIFVTFLLACLLSYALGTSFGVAGTVGVIFMALARSGGVNEAIAAGAVMSGVYFGDRGSPVSSSANLVAAVSHTTLYKNVKVMMKTGLIPVAVCSVIYLVLSIRNPIEAVNQGVLETLQTEFDINLWLLVPAVLMLILPLFKVNVLIAIGASVVSAFIVTIGVQDIPVLTALNYIVFGYVPQSSSLGTILSGGGVLSMLEVCGIVMLSCSYSGIFSGTEMLSGAQWVLKKLVDKIGKFATMVITSLVTNGIFCNQTIASIMCSDLMTPFYETQEGEKTELAIDIENSAIVLAGLVPWTVACTVPLGMLGVGFEALPYSVLLYMIPVCYGITKKIWYK